MVLDEEVDAIVDRYIVLESRTTERGYHEDTLSLAIPELPTVNLEIGAAASLSARRELVRMILKKLVLDVLLAERREPPPSRYDRDVEIQDE